MFTELFHKGDGWASSPVFEPDAIRRMEQDAESQFGLTADTLMENAGAAAARLLLNLFPNKQRFIFLIGPGNNGGDGVVAARYIHRAGKKIRLFLHQKAIQRPSELLSKNVRRLHLPSFVDTEEPSSPIADSETVVIDALFGIGFEGDLDDDAIRLLHLFPNSTTIAFDIPSGLHAKTGLTAPNTRTARHTLCFGCLKTGYFLEDGKRMCGQLHSIDIGLPQSEKPAFWRVTPADSTDNPVGAHKYENGTVFILAGSEGMTGAAMYSAKAAWQSGAGIVKLFVPRGLLDVYEKLIPFAVKIPVGAEQDRWFKPEHLSDLTPHLRSKNASLICGPGIGRRGETLQLISDFLPDLELPLILDADALLALQNVNRLSKSDLLTPHSGELSKITSLETQTDSSRIFAAYAAHEKWGCAVLSKGNPTILVDSAGHTHLFDYETSAFNRAGFGDVLSGYLGTAVAKRPNDPLAPITGAFKMHQKALKLGENLVPEDFF